MKVEEILQEIESMATLDHPNVIKAGPKRLLERSGRYEGMRFRGHPRTINPRAVGASVNREDRASEPLPQCLILAAGAGYSVL